ncbi:MAG: OmpA family protein [Nitrospirota bacterium]|nr:OmpA family protein [Nitrospirota bacterium]
MRKSIIGLSILFLILSGIITFRALELPGNNARDQDLSVNTGSNAPGTVTTEAGEQPAEIQETVQQASGEPQAAVTDLKDKKTDNEIGGTEKIARQLAVLGEGTFSSGQATINKDQMDIIKRLVPAILASPGTAVMIEGHTDSLSVKTSDGARYRDNIELSYLRAKAVADVLAENGISPSRISIRGYGDTRPIGANDTAEGRIMNRRVEVMLIRGER